MTAETLRDLSALTRAARVAPLDRDAAVLALVKGLLACGVDDPELLRARLDAAGIHERSWVQAATWARGPVETLSRQAVRASFLTRHGVTTLPR